MWSRAVIDKYEGGEGGIRMSPQIVDFSKVYSLPVLFLESWLGSRGDRRLRLLPPYREHLSQAFARFFMRVGLPQDINLR